jgi:hypothetical protein
MTRIVCTCSVKMRFFFLDIFHLWLVDATDVTPMSRESHGTCLHTHILVNPDWHTTHQGREGELPFSWRSPMSPGATSALSRPLTQQARNASPHW